MNIKLMNLIISKTPNLKPAVIAIAFAVLVSGCQTFVATPEDDLQRALDTGRDVALMPGKVYEVSQTLKYRRQDQKIYTKGAKYPSDYATLRIADRKVMMLLNAHGIKGATLENVICDGNRYEMSVVPKPKIGGGGQPALVHFGGNGGHDQVVRNCVFMSTRTWATLKMHEGAGNALAENNLFFGAGVDPRGNGRELEEVPFGWADAISCAATDSLIRNNFITDPTDVGVVLYCAPGTVVEENAIASISRESLGGINLVDGLGYFKMKDTSSLAAYYSDGGVTAEEKKKGIDRGFFDYRGVKIRNNYIDAFGGRIHMHIPVGCVVWVPHWRGKILTGGEVTGNTIAGGAGAYGIVAHGLTDWKITGNKSTASYSGLAEIPGHKNPPDAPGPYIYDGPSVKDCELQSEFVNRERHIEHLLRTQFAPQSEHGYQMHEYGDAEVEAVVASAYLEMLGRPAEKGEMKESIELLRSRKMNGDGLRRHMMGSTEFKEKFGEVDADKLHQFRVQRWFDVCDKILRENGGMPAAVDLYKAALAGLRVEKRVLEANRDPKLLILD